MSRITRQIAFFTIALATAHAQGKLDQTGRRFLSEKYGFSIAIPRGWSQLANQDTPLFVSYPASRALPQGRIPEGGAIISIVPLDAFKGLESRTLFEWAVADARGDSAGSAPIRPFEMPSQSGVTTAIISSHDTPTFGPDDQSQHTVNIFWEFRRKLFAAHLLYPAHDPRGAEFEKTFLDTVRSVRSLEKAAKRP